MSKYTQTMRDALVSMSEGFSKKEIKMAIGIASDPRYKGGNYTGAFNAIEKIKKGLAKHPQVAAVLKRQNTSFDPEIAESGHDDVKSAKNQVQIAMSALEKMNTELGKLKDEDALPTWWTNKVAIAVDKLDGMADYLDTQVEEVELDEKVKEYKGVAYFKTRKDAEEHMKKFAPKGRVVEFGRGYAVQTRISGPYLNKTGKAEEVELDEAMKYTHAVVDPDGKVAGMTTDEKDAKDIASRHKGKVVKLKKPIAQKVGDMMINRPLKEEETVVESWELDEMKMDDPKLLKIFDKLKKGSTVKIKIDSSISKGKDYREFTVTAKNIVGKGKKFEQEKITLKAKDNPTGVKHFLYNRDGKVTLAIGDMGASIADIKENKMSAYTAAITKGVK